MSGLEALGALASAAQVVAYVVKVVAFLSDVSERLKQASERIRQHVHQIERLIDTILQIKENPSLHTQIIFAQLDSTITQAYSFQTLLSKLLSQSKHSSFRRRYLEALGGRKEKLVLAALENLEREKTGLLLCLMASLHNVGREARMANSNTSTRAGSGSSLGSTFAQAPISSSPHFIKREQGQGNDKQLMLYKGSNEHPEDVEMNDGQDLDAEKGNTEQCDDGNDSKEWDHIMIDCPISEDDSSQINGTLGSFRGKVEVKRPRSQNNSFQINGRVCETYPLEKFIHRNV